jgi:hypothetical protein
MVKKETENDFSAINNLINVPRKGSSFDIGNNNEN